MTKKKKPTKKQQRDQLIDALNRIDGLADRGAEGYNEKKQLAKDYNLVFDFIFESTK
jgi:hypothetical protein